VIALSPENATGYRNLAGMYLLMGRYGEAIPLLSKSLDLTPTAAGYTNLGTAYYYQGRYGEAVAAMEKAVEQQPHNYVLWGNLGDANSRISPDAAKTAWSRAAELARMQLATHASEPQAQSSLAVYEARLGLAQAALADIAEVRRSAPRNARVLWKAAIVYEISGRRTLALSALKDALSAGESSTNIGREPDFAALRADASCAKYLTKEVCDGSN
jgi:serine/threonine-protein kinase